MKSRLIQAFRHRVYLPFSNLVGHFVDWKNGVKTQAIIELDELGIDRSKGARLETVSWHKLHTAIAYAKKQGFDKFVDIGCGLGRPLIVANKEGFSKLSGVDISEILIKNCKINLIEAKVSAELLCLDVDLFELPEGKLVIYLFNPVGEEKMFNLIRKIKMRKYPTLVIYFNPKHNNLFESSHKVHQIIWSHFGLYDEKCYFYLYQP